MQLQATQVVDLLDGHNQRLGRISIEQVEDDVVFGTFVPAPDFTPVEPLFTEFVEAANDQLFHRVDELDTAIAALGLHLGPANGSRFPEICDVEIAGANISFKTRKAGRLRR